MGRARRANILRVSVESLERRDNPSTFGGGPPIANAHPSPIMPRTDFHHVFLNTLRVREYYATQAANRLSQAFQLFEQNALGIPPKLNGLPQRGPGTPVPAEFRQLKTGQSVPVVSVPAGTLPTPDTYQAYFNQLTAFTHSALTTYVARTYRQYPSIRTDPNFSPRAQNILVPFANTQLAQAEQIFMANQPVFDPTTGALQNPEPRQAIEAAFNSILYAVGEYTVHPNLFVNSSDFYVDPSYTFKIPYTSDPAAVIPNVYGRGPGGVALPGARH